MKLFDILLQDVPTPTPTTAPTLTPTATPNNIVNSVVSGTDWGGLFVLILLIVLLIWIINLVWRTRNANLTDIKFPKVDTRTSLALGVVVISIIGVVFLAGIAILNADDKSATTTQVMTAILPLLGTWVGTVMAYYFGRENYETATNSAVALTQGKTLEEILSSTKVTDRMISRAAAFFIKLTGPKSAATLQQVNLDQALNDLKAAGTKNNQTWYRIPILDDQLHAVFVVHDSFIDKFINKAVAAGKVRSSLTLDDLYNDADFHQLLDESFEVVSANATLADAKAAMAKSKSCQDVFVTQNGSEAEVVLGWITNNTIQDAGKV